MSDERWNAALAACARSAELTRALDDLWLHASRDSLLDGLIVATADEGEPRPVFAEGYEEGEDRLVARLTPSWNAAVRGESSISSRDGGVDTTVPLRVAETDPTLGALTVRIGGEAADKRTAVHIARHVAGAVERDRQRRRLEARARLEASAEAASIIAQELRDPLLGVSSASQLLRFRASEDPVLEKNVGRMLRDVERLNRLTTALLEFGRPLPLVRSATDPDGIWDDVVEQQRGLLESRALVLQRSRTDRATQVSADQEQLSRAFALLLQAAAETAPEATDLTLHCERTSSGWCSRLTSEAPLDAEAHRHALELLFSSRNSAGGLGLALGRRIVEAHGGTLTLQSSGGRSTLQVILPAS